MAAWNALRLVGGVMDSDFEPEPPAPLPFAEYAAQLAGHHRPTHGHSRMDPFEQLGGTESPTGAYDGLMSVFDKIGGDITSLAHALGLDSDTNPDMDRPRAA